MPFIQSAAVHEHSMVQTINSKSKAFLGLSINNAFPWPIKHTRLLLCVRLQNPNQTRKSTHVKTVLGANIACEGTDKALPVVLKYQG